jgi:nucleotide-binding universal stress UspA family protein
MPGIVVGIDGSSHSAHALEWAIKEGAVQHAGVSVIIVHPVPASPWTGNPYVLDGEPGELEKLRQNAEEMVQKATSQLDDKPASVSVYATTGYPVQELIDASRDADLVVVGSRGAGGFAQLVMGSVSSQVVQHAHCPVVVVPSHK